MSTKVSVPRGKRDICDVCYMADNARGSCKPIQDLGLPYTPEYLSLPITTAHKACAQRFVIQQLRRIRESGYQGVMSTIQEDKPKMQAHLDNMPDSTTTSDDEELEVETSKNSSTTTASDHATSESSASETKTDHDDTSTEAAPSESQAQLGVIVTNTMEQKEAASAAGQFNQTTPALSEDVISHPSSLKPEAAMFVFNPKTAASALNAAALPFFAPLTT